MPVPRGIPVVLRDQWGALASGLLLRGACAGCPRGRGDRVQLCEEVAQLRELLGFELRRGRFHGSRLLLRVLGV
jgi:hypothetical protein